MVSIQHLLAGPTPDLSIALDAGSPLVLDVGFGTGEAVIAYACAEPATRILPVDMRTPGIGDLLASIDELGLSNVYLLEADVHSALPRVPTDAFTGVRTFFPDPWRVEVAEALTRSLTRRLARDFGRPCSSLPWRALEAPSP